MKQVKHSRQRELVLQTVRENRVHPTAEQVYSILREKEPNISLATVYRNLQFLADNGSLLKLSVAGTPDRFDGDVASHCHIVCERCSRLTDIASSYDSISDEHVAKQSGYRIKGHSLMFYGICPECDKV